ncbi:MAG TPA: SGNH/GDSL hydrolase family protein [Bacteroidota bacterium]|nr:SGNH/GDSL hydrolase family protein [Bacteroidota bacterium]
MKIKLLYWIKLTAANLALFLFLLLMSEGILRLMGKRYVYQRTYPSQFANRSFVSDTNIVKVSWPKEDSTLGWVCSKLNRINFSNKLNNQKLISYTINDEGFRNSQNFPTVPQKCTKRRIMLLGDSFLFGVYLPDTSTISYLIQKEIGQNTDVFNMGIPGWGIDQMYLTYLKYNVRLRPNIVILFFIDDDIARVLESYRRAEGMNKPSFKVENSQLVLRIDDQPGMIENTLASSVLLNPIYRWILKMKSMKISSMILEKLYRETQENHQQLLIVRIPRFENYMIPETNEWYRMDLSSFAGKERVIDLYDDFKKMPPEKVHGLYLHDGHFSQTGAELAAEKVIGLLNHY